MNALIECLTAILKSILVGKAFIYPSVKFAPAMHYIKCVWSIPKHNAVGKSPSKQQICGETGDTNNLCNKKQLQHYWLGLIAGRENEGIKFCI